MSTLRACLNYLFETRVAVYIIMSYCTYVVVKRWRRGEEVFEWKENGTMPMGENCGPEKKNII